MGAEPATAALVPVRITKPTRPSVRAPRSPEAACLTIDIRKPWGNIHVQGAIDPRTLRELIEALG